MNKRSLVILPVMFALAAVAGVSRLGLGLANDPADDLFRAFQDPPRKYSPEPFWFWNGKMEGDKVAEQVRRMVDQHVFGAFLHARDGLETPYLSEEWWRAVGGGLAEARRLGFSFDFVDEYDWPSGEVRNVWRTDSHQSEVIARRPEFRQRTLAHRDEIIRGPKDVRLKVPAEVQAVIAAKWLGNDRVDGSSLRTVTPAGAGGELVWPAPAGEWVLSIFSLEPGTGFDGGYVDLLNPEAMRLFTSLYHEEFYRRFGQDFGKTIHYAFADHEGDDGCRIAWTPALFDEFAREKGYDLRGALPLLYFDGGKDTVKVRCDYLEVVTHLYDSSFWSGITAWAKAHGLGRTGHGWEDRLSWAAAFHGDLFTIERGLDPVGVDSLFDFGRQPIAFKVAQSVADFEGRRFMCENQGVQGTDSYLDLEGIRRGTNGIATWGVNLFVPHAVNYNPAKANYPPDWLHQPYWPYFHYYADYARRVSYMNGESRRVVNLAVYYPITSVWAHADSVFSNATNYYDIMNLKQWNATVNQIEDYNTRLMLDLTARQWDYSYMDDDYLEKARIEGRELVIGDQSFGAIILPPLTTIRRTALEKLTEFYRAGGLILAIRRLPDSSPEAGGDDPVIREGVAALFGESAGLTPLAFTASENANGGRAAFVSSDIGSLLDLLEARLPKDVRIAGGRDDGLICQHRRKLGHDYYWVANDSDRPRTNEVIFSAQGRPEKWDALTGEKSPLWYTNGPDGTEVRLSFGAWDGCYVVFDPRSTARQDLRVISSNAEAFDLAAREPESIRVHIFTPATAPRVEISLGGAQGVYHGELAAGSLRPISLGDEWMFRPEPDRVAVPYAKVNDAPSENGAPAAWARPDFDDAAWPELWLSEAQNTLREWNMIGPFPNEDDSGFARSFPPETEFRTDKTYTGDKGEIVGWKRYYGDVPHYEEGTWNIWATQSGGPFADAAHIVQFGRLLPTQGKDWVICYAQVFLYSPDARRANFILAADNAARVWLNGRPIYERLRHPFWYEMNDNWADKIPVELRAGWNPVLVKVGVGRFAASGYFGFTFRVADDTGTTIPGILGSLEPYDVKSAPRPAAGFRWYRIEVPPGCVAVVPPALRGLFRMFLDGAEIKTEGQAPVDIRRHLTPGKNIFALVAGRDDRLSRPVEFVTGFTPFRLKPWTRTGLANFSGTAVYEKDFSVPESYAGKKLILDCGRLSAVVDVSVNGRPAGAAVWRPFRVDITNLIRPGSNRLTLRITNTEANRRAVGTYRRILKNIDVDGLEGPVEIVPYLDTVLECRRTAAFR
jgi:hypothetical protein